MLYKCPNPKHQAIYEDPPFTNCPVKLGMIIRKKRRKKGNITISEVCNLPLEPLISNAEEATKG